jgi:hypothetical protein
MRQIDKREGQVGREKLEVRTKRTTKRGKETPVRMSESRGWYGVGVLQRGEKEGWGILWSCHPSGREISHCIGAVTSFSTVVGVYKRSTCNSKQNARKRHVLRENHVEIGEEGIKGVEVREGVCCCPYETICPCKSACQKRRRCANINK